MKILLIEDDKFFQKFYAFKLQEQKFEVAVASDGVEGMTKIVEFMPNIILLDLVMPNKDGFEVLKDKAANPAIAQIPVIVFSTLSQEKDVEKAKSLGAKDVMNKSFFDFEKLLAKINTYIN